MPQFLDPDRDRIQIGLSFSKDFKVDLSQVL
jgi:hypothetical protein